MTRILILLALSFLFHDTATAQSALAGRLELRRLELENKYRTVGYFDTVTCIATVYQDGKMGYIDSAGKLILPIAYVTNDFSDGIGVYHDYVQKVFRAIDRHGNVIREFRDIVGMKGFHKGQAKFAAYAQGRLLYGFMDLQGRKVLENRYPYIERISEHYYYVNSNSQGSGIINEKGDTLIPVRYGMLYTDTTDLHFIGYTAEQGYGIYDRNGDVLKYWGREVYDQSSYVEGNHYFQRDSLIIIKDQFSSGNARMALVNLNLDTIVPMGRYRYTVVNEGMVSYMDTVNVYTEKGVLKGRSERAGFLDTKGVVRIPAQYEFAQYFLEGLAAVKLNDKWGYIDKEGHLSIPIRFDMAYPFRDGYAKVKIGEAYFIIDRTGKIVLKSKPV